MNAYIRFCLYFDRVPVPADQVTLRAYLAFLARSLNPSSILGYLNVVRIMHVSAGLDIPLKDNFELGMIKRGNARSRGKPPRQKLPITVSILSLIYAMLDFSLGCDRAFWAACLIGFYGML
jgi:hypothetical protein